MTDRLKILLAVVVMAGAVQSPAAEAAGLSKAARQAQMLPTKPAACKKSWPYVVLICVA